MADPRAIATSLLDDLKAGRLPKIGIEEIRAAIERSGEPWSDAFEEAVTRAVVRLCG